MRAHLLHAPAPSARLVAGQRLQQAPRAATTKTSANPSTEATTETSSSAPPSPPSPPTMVVAELRTADALAVANAMAGSTGIDVDSSSSRASTSGAASTMSSSSSSFVVEQVRRSSSTSSSTNSSSAFSLAETALSEPADAFDSWLLTEAGLQDWVGAVGLRPDDIALDGLVSQMATRYDPELLAAGVAPARGTAALAARAARVAATLGSLAASIAADAATGSLEANAPLRARALRDALASLGPAFVKVGQTLSARPDLLPKPYLDALSELQDSLDPFPTPLALAMLEEELGLNGASIRTVFSSISPEPVAAASLGQVYKATLASTGESVAVKVQRPGIAATLAVDMVLLRRLARAVDTKAPAFLERLAGSSAAALLAGSLTAQPLAPLVDEFASKVFAELDFVSEGQKSERFERLYSDIPGVRVPKVHWAATRRRVLTTAWVEGGVKLTAPRRELEAAGVDVKKAVNAAVACTLRQVFGEGFVHGDAHPGNLLATSEALYWIDFGIVCEVPERARSLLVGHVAHLVGRRYDLMTKDYVALEFLPADVDAGPIEPALRDFFDDVLSAPVSELNMRAIVDGLGAVLFQFPFNVNANPFYVTMLRSLASLEGIALSVDPEFQLLGACWPYVAGRLLLSGGDGDDGKGDEDLRDALLSLVLVDDKSKNSASNSTSPAKINWERLDSLLEAGAQIPGGLPPDALAKLATWALSGGNDSKTNKKADGRLRGAAAAEAARLLDAAVADRVRTIILEAPPVSSSPSSLIESSNNSNPFAAALSGLLSSAAAAGGGARALADRVAPSLPGDAEAARRARSLLRLAAPHLPKGLAAAVGVSPPALPYSSGEVRAENDGGAAAAAAAPLAASSPSPPSLSSSSSPSAVNVQEALSLSREAFSLASDALATAAGREAAAALARELAARFAARSLKALLGGGSGSGSSSKIGGSNFGSGPSGRRRVSAFTRGGRIEDGVSPSE